ncbi:MAG: hypothetical protein AAGC97_10620 [Planctomycetota bacterium]
MGQSSLSLSIFVAAAVAFLSSDTMAQCGGGGSRAPGRTSLSNGLSSQGLAIQSPVMRRSSMTPMQPSFSLQQQQLLVVRQQQRQQMAQASAARQNASRTQRRALAETRRANRAAMDASRLARLRAEPSPRRESRAVMLASTNQ